MRGARPGKPGRQTAGASSRTPQSAPMRARQTQTSRQVCLPGTIYRAPTRICVARRGIILSVVPRGLPFPRSLRPRLVGLLGRRLVEPGRSVAEGPLLDRKFRRWLNRREVLRLRVPARRAKPTARDTPLRMTASTQRRPPEKQGGRYKCKPTARTLQG
jgi:hypothetical protein